MVKRRKYIVLVRKGNPKQVTFNGRTFNANFRRGKRTELPAHITFAKHKRQKAKKRIPAWLNSIGRRKHARKLARNAKATKKAIKKISKKKVHFSIVPPIANPGITKLKNGPTFFHKWTGKKIKSKIGRRQAAARAKRKAANPSPHRIRTKKTKKRKMGGRGISDVAKSITSNPYAQEIGKRLLTKGIGYLPKLFKKGTSKIKNKHLRSIAQSEIAEELVNRGTKRLLTRSNDLIGGL